jgi:hypothetical protein
MQIERNMYGFEESIDDRMRGLPMLTAHQVWKQLGTEEMRSVCIEAGVRYDFFALVRIGKKNFSYAVARKLQYTIFSLFRVVVSLDTLCNAIAFREHEEEKEKRAFEAAKVPA